MVVTATTPERLSDGLLPSHAWPGGYPIYYLFADGGTCCPDCANGKNKSDAYVKGARAENDRDKQWELAAMDVHWEGSPLTCGHCNGQIESAYGDPEEAKAS